MTAYKYYWSEAKDELMQIAIRLGISVSVLIIAYIFFIGADSQKSYTVIVFSIALFFYTLATLTWVLLSPKQVPFRIGLAIVADVAFLSVALALFGDWTQMFFWVYLVVIIGNGYRYGHRYVLFSAAVSLLGASLAWWLSPDWQYTEKQSIAGIAILTIAPLYIYVLIAKLNDSLEREKQANIIKSQFLANMSHEIRTPMNGILGMLDLTLEDDLKENTRKDIEVARGAAESLLTLLNDILDISKLEADKIILESKDFSLHYFLEDMGHLLQPSAMKKNITLHLQLEKGSIDWVKGDCFKLRQILLNIVSNAIKFTNKGGVSVTAFATEESGIVQLKCTVKDTGIGMTAEEQKDIFKLFSQADSSTSREYGGSGLGLAIARLIVERMEGTLEVASKKGEGSTFFFDALLEKGQAKEKAVVQKSAMTEDIRYQGAQILVVEDNVVNQIVVTKMLESLHVSVDILNNGKEALDYFEENLEHPYQLIFMDCQMPEMDGYQATENIKKIWQANKKAMPIPIVALTANVMEGDKEKCAAAGMDDYITKPVKKEQIDASLQKWL